eukprot:m.319400 g.319400  ORF g.319400 m.319400 type:complete len:85 (+) comp16517_c0_seq56:1342-1596(+)
MRFLKLSKVSQAAQTYSSRLQRFKPFTLIAQSAFVSPNTFLENPKTLGFPMVCHLACYSVATKKIFLLGTAWQPSHSNRNRVRP